MSQLVVLWANECKVSPFASLEIRKDVPMALSRDLQSLAGTRQIIIPITPKSMSMWCQDHGDIPGEVRPGVVVKGGIMPMLAGQPVEVLPQLWKQIEIGDATCRYVVCSTPKGLHKLNKEQRVALLSLGFSCLPSGQGEFWSIQTRKVC